MPLRSVENVRTACGLSQVLFGISLDVEPGEWAELREDPALLDRLMAP
jgi:hypothetical protein